MSLYRKDIGPKTQKEAQKLVRKDSMKIWFKFLKDHWGIYTVGFITVFFSDITQVFITLTIGWVIDFFSGNKLPAFFERFDANGTDGKESIFLFLFLFLIFLRIIQALSRIGWRVTLGRQTHFAAAMLKAKIWDSVRFFKKSDLNEHYTKGILMNASTSDVGSSRFIFGFTLIGVADVLFLSIVTLWAMFNIHIEMTLWSLAAMIFLPYAIKVLSDLEIMRYSEAQNALGIFNDISSQVVATIKMQRLTQTGKFWEKRLNTVADLYRIKRLKAAYTTINFIPVMGGSSILSYIVLFILGIHLVFKGEMSIGDFIAMQGLIFTLQDPLLGLGFLISEWKKAQTSLTRLDDIYNLEKEQSLLIAGYTSELTGLPELKEAQTVFSVSNLSFTYPDASFNGDNPVLHNISLTLCKGERLGITGPIGSGKTTLVHILSGLERGFKGEVLFFGRPIQNYSHKDLRKVMAYIHQRPFLFADTIRENIAMERTMPDEEIWHYLHLAGLDNDVRKFPDGLETPLGEWGINLSGGQKQRLTLARALSRRPRILFLDDCLSAVDTVTEEIILQNLDREMKDTTLIWTAHRKSTLKYCNQFLELNS